MKTTHQKFHPDATPPEGAVYIGSEGGWDHFITGNTLLCTAGVSRLEPTIEDVLRWSDRGNDNWHSAATLIRAHREKQSTPTPMTREEVLEAVVADAREQRGWHLRHGSTVKVNDEDIISRINAVLPSKPAPTPEPVKSENQKLAEAMFLVKSKARIVCVAGEAVDVVQAHSEEQADAFVYYARWAVVEALDTRDRQHAETLRKELEALRERIIENLRIDGFIYVTDKIRAIPLTIAERSDK